MAVYLGYGANRGQRFENDILALMRQCREVVERLFYGQQ
jgi:glutamate-ammonia-ligase adenylyltransferase